MECSPPRVPCLFVPPWPSSPSPSSCPCSTGLHLACLLTPDLSYDSSILPVSQELSPLDSGRCDSGFGSKTDLGTKLGVTICIPWTSYFASLSMMSSAMGECRSKVRAQWEKSQRGFGPKLRCLPYKLLQRPSKNSSFLPKVFGLARLVSRDSRVSALSERELQAGATIPGFYMGAWFNWRLLFHPPVPKLPL